MPYAKTGPFTNGSATPAISKAFLDGLETGVDEGQNRRGFVTATEYGAKLDGTTDDTTAIQNALNTGHDVLIAGTATTAGVAKTTATLVMKSTATRQRLVCQNATIQPAFLGDVVQVTTFSECRVSITGALQPSTGDFSNVAAIRIGSATYNPQQASVAYSDVRNFKGSAVIWDNGAMIDFTHFHADTVSYDGIRGTTVGTDCNHGLFAGTHIVAAAGKGYAFYGDGSNLSANSSRHHVFADAKAFGCGQNWYIESRDCEGSIFSENSTTASTTTSTSRGNYLRIIETATEFENWVDSGQGNRIEGYSNGNAWETKQAIIRSITLGGTSTTAGTTFSSVVSGQYTVPSTTLGAGASAVLNPGVSGLGTGRVVTATLYSSIGNIAVTGYVDAGGALHFLITNTYTSSQTVTGTISYVIWRFA